MTLLLCCLLAVAGFIAGFYLCRVSESYVRLYAHFHSPTPHLLRLACLRALRRPTRVRQSVCYALLLGALLVLLGITSPSWPALLAFTAALIMLLLLMLIDGQICVLPDALTQPLLWVGLALAWRGEGLVSVDAALVSAMASYLALRALSELYRFIRRREGLGRGDVKLIAAIGAWLGWQDTVMVVVIGSLLGLLLTLRHLKRLPSLATPQPFGPPLIAATLLIAIVRVAEQA